MKKKVNKPAIKKNIANLNARIDEVKAKRESLREEAKRMVEDGDPEIVYVRAEQRKLTALCRYLKRQKNIATQAIQYAI